ncbi:MAG: inositol monophosphatase family protein [Patescibacteria group bacterium]
MKKELLLKLGLEIIEEVSTEIKKYARHNPLGGYIGRKGSGGDQIKIGDYISEKGVAKVLARQIKRKKFDYIILISEEMGVTEFGKLNSASKSIFIILDPVDGSNNMRSWVVPSCFVGISVALGELGNINKYANLDAVEVGIVKDIFHDDIFYAIKSKGAFFLRDNKKQRIKSSPETDLHKSLVGISIDRFGEKFDKILTRLLPLLREKYCQRRIGSTVLDLVKVASGEWDGYVSLSSGVKIHDIAAVRLIIIEAGGVFKEKEVKGLSQNGVYLKELIKTKNPKIIEEIGFMVVACGNKSFYKRASKILKGSF